MIEVIVPFYGDPAYLRTALESVLAQTVKPDRIVVLDDCYPDDAVGEWVRGLHEVTYERNRSNLGANLNYRKALAMAESDFVVLMGADDVMLPSFIERSLDLITAHEPDVIQGGVRVIDENGVVRLPLVDRIKGWCRLAAGTHEGEAAVGSVLRGNWTYFPSLVWRRAAITSIGFRQFDVVQDLALLVDTLVGGGRLLVDDQVTFEYRRHSVSDSSLRAHDGRRFGEERTYFNTIAAELTDLGWDSAALSARGHITSRLHSASLLPATVAKQNWRGASSAIRHTLT